MDPLTPVTSVSLATPAQGAVGICDEVIRHALEQLPFCIPAHGYRAAFDCYDMAYHFLVADQTMTWGTDDVMASGSLTYSRQSSAMTCLLYSTFMMMMCEPIEERLPEWAKRSPALQGYCELFHGEGGCFESLVWHIRGALYRGHLQFREQGDLPALTLTDHHWSLELGWCEVLDLCNQIRRFMMIACQVAHQRVMM